MSTGNAGVIHCNAAAAIGTARRQLRDAQMRAWLAASTCYGEGAGDRGIAHIRVSGEAKRRRCQYRWRIVAAAACVMTIAAALLG